jgi:hypothetical protein
MLPRRNLTNACAVDRVVSASVRPGQNQAGDRINPSRAGPIPTDRVETASTPPAPTPTGAARSAAPKRRRCYSAASGTTASVLGQSFRRSISQRPAGPGGVAVG